MKGFGHEAPVQGAKDDWLTPPGIIAALGPFDLDPCASVNQPWDTATTHFNANDDGLSRAWEGFVWCNPPYGPQAVKWMRRMSEHGNGIALIFARTETRGFFETVWESPSVTCLLFMRGRLHFHKAVTGERSASAGAPSVLVGYGDLARVRLVGAAGLGQIVVYEGRGG